MEPSVRRGGGGGGILVLLLILVVWIYKGPEMSHKLAKSTNEIIVTLAPYVGTALVIILVIFVIRLYWSRFN
jgi:hypothetical protein